MLKIQQKGVLTGHSGAIYSMATCNELNTIYTCSGDNYLVKWDCENLKQQSFAAKLNAPVYAIAYVDGYNWIVGGTSSGAVNIIDLKQNKEIKYLQFDKEAIHQIHAIAHLNLLFVGTALGNLYVYSLPDFKCLARVNVGSAKIRSILFNNRTNCVWVSNGENSIYEIACDSLAVKSKIETMQKGINCLAFDTLANRLLAGSRDAQLAFIDLTNNALRKLLPAHNFAIYDIQFNNELKLYATASRDKSFKLWDITADEVLIKVNAEVYKGHTNSVNKLVWLDKQTLVSCSDDRAAIVWSLFN